MASDYLKNHPDIQDKIRRLHSEGKSINEIAAEVPYRYSTVRNFLLQNGLIKPLTNDDLHKGNLKEGERTAEEIEDDEMTDWRARHLNLIRGERMPLPDNHYIVRQYGKKPYVASDVTATLMWCWSHGEEARCKRHG